MRCCAVGLVVLSLLVAPRSLRAEDPSVQAAQEELRRQIELFQGALEKLESRVEKTDRVTQISGSRLPQREVGLVVRLYDVSDLFAVAPSYEAFRLNDLQPGTMPMFPMEFLRSQAAGGAMGGGMGGMGGGMFRVSEKALPKTVETPPVLAAVEGAQSTRTSLDQLIQAITTTIAPTTWSEVGGEGSIAVLGRALLISTEVKNHEQIEALLNLFRQRWKTLRTITVRANWLWLTDEQLAALVPAKNAEYPGLAMVDERAWQNRPKKDELFGAGYRALITCYNGQTVHTLSGGQSLHITSFQATSPASNDPKLAASISYVPGILAVQDGAALQVTPLVSSSGKYVALDVHSRVTKVIPAPARKSAEMPADKNADKKIPGGKSSGRALGPAEVVDVIDRSTVISQRLSTTLRVPLDRHVLVGGMTFETEPDQPAGTLYLFMSASVQELLDDAPLTVTAPKR